MGGGNGVPACVVRAHIQDVAENALHRRDACGTPDGAVWVGWVVVGGWGGLLIGSTISSPQCILEETTTFGG